MALATRIVHPDSLYKNLSGFFCVYKPPDMNLAEIYNELKYCLAKGTNETWKGKQKQFVKVDGNQITLTDDLSDRVESK